MELVCTEEEFKGHLKCTALKYIIRMGQKSGESLLDDAQKAKWYVDKLVATLQDSDKKGI